MTPFPDRTFMAEKDFRPGERIPHSGVYLVVHREHRPTHEATLVAGKPFPGCARCGTEVRFRLLRNANSIEKDPDFSAEKSAAEPAED